MAVERFGTKQRQFSELSELVSGSHLRSRYERELMSLMLAVSMLALTVSVLILIVITKRNNAGFEIASLDTVRPRIGVDGPRGREHYFARTRIQGERKYAGKVHYVAEIIRGAVRQEEEAIKLAGVIVSLSKELNYDPLLVAAVIKSESTFKHKAKSPVGALGLMQLMPGTGRYISKKAQIEWQGESMLLDPQNNIRLGIEYLKSLEKDFNGNLAHALIAYNWGPFRLKSALGRDRRIPRSPVQYAINILSDHQRWLKEYTANPGQFEYFEAPQSPLRKKA